MSAVVPQPPASPAPHRARHDWSAYWFLLPNAAGFLVFTLVPVLAAFLLSFTRWDAVESWQGIHFVGLENYRQILGFGREEGAWRANDSQFWYTMYNTVFLMLGIPLGMALSFVTALLMNQRLRGITFYRVVYFLPTVCSSVAVAVVWRWVYDADWGLLNQSLRMVGVDSPPGWLVDPSWAKPALIDPAQRLPVAGQRAPRRRRPREAQDHRRTDPVRRPPYRPVADLRASLAPPARSSGPQRAP